MEVPKKVLQKGAAGGGEKGATRRCCKTGEEQIHIINDTFIKPFSAAGAAV